MIIRRFIYEGQQPTPEQCARLDRLDAMRDEDIVYDEDCPKLTEEELAQFRRVNPLPQKMAS